MAKGVEDSVVGCSSKVERCAANFADVLKNFANRLEKIKERTSTGVTNMSQADRLELTCDCGNRGSANFNAKTVEGFYVAMAGYDSITRELYLRCCNCNHQLKLNTKTREVSLLFRD